MLQYSRSVLAATPSHYISVLKSLDSPEGMLRVSTTMNSTHQGNFLTDPRVYQSVKLPAGVAKAEQCSLA